MSLGHVHRGVREQCDYMGGITRAQRGERGVGRNKVKR